MFSVCSAYSQFDNRISASMKIEKLNNGKVVRIGADVFIDMDNLKMTTHFRYPSEYILMSNNKGEMKLYYPKENKVYVNQSKILSAQSDIIFYLLTTKEYNFGLNQEGCKLKDTKFEDNLMVTYWEPPLSQQKELKELKFVYENNKPIYSAYINHKGKIVKKTYYYDYKFVNNFPIPTKVTEYLFMKDGSKVISRKTYSNLKSGPGVSRAMVDYVIPDDAKVVE